MVTAAVTTTARGGLVRCGVGPAAVGLDTACVVGVERADRLRPAAGPGPVGVIVNRAGEWPVFNLAERLGLNHRPHPRTGQIVLIDAGGERFGLLVDRVSPVPRGESAELGPVPRAVGREARGLFAGAALLADGPLLVLAADRLFAPPPAELPPPPPRRAGKAVAADRLLIFGVLEFPAPAGRPVGFGLPTGCVAELVEPGPGAGVAGAAAWVQDVIAWRGKPVAVIDVANWVGLRSPADVGRRVVVVRTGGGNEHVALLAGRGVRMLPLPLAVPHAPSRRKLPLTPGRAKAVVDFNDLTLIVPDVAKLAGG